MSTTIYQIHEYSGEWEDYRDTIVGSYFKKSDAKENMEIMEQEAKDEDIQSKKCVNCPSHKLKFDKEGIEEIKQYCNNFEPSEEKNARGEGYCVNCFFSVYNDAPTYEIAEVEVN